MLQGVNLVQAREKGQLVFVEALKASAAVMLDQTGGDVAQMFDYLRSNTHTLFLFHSLCLPAFITAMY